MAHDQPEKKADDATDQPPQADGSVEAAGDDSAESSELSMAEKNKRSVIKLMVIIAGSFAFALASIPMYRMVCAKLDPGGSSSQNGQVDEYKDVEVDESRTVDVRFTSEVNGQLDWEFGPTESRVKVHPGEKRLTDFEAKNLDRDNELTGKGVYDINPPQAGQYFKKIECFCFTEQTLAAGEEVDMPLYFWFDPDMPDDIDEVTIAYTFFNADSSRARAIDEKAANVPQ
ncbi:MAG: cytochrome c oxidase assembly protein [Persicimonas sp.]